jgi:hypothetical protein
MRGEGDECGPMPMPMPTLLGPPQPPQNYKYPSSAAHPFHTQPKVAMEYRRGMGEAKSTAMMPQRYCSQLQEGGAR